MKKSYFCFLICLNMKIIHTSDWHIGKKLYNHSIDETLTFFFDWLINKINEEKLDYLIVSGDIFNSPFPSQSSLKLYYTTLYRLTQTSLRKIILIAGNHDSNATLSAPKDILEMLDIKIISGIPQDLSELIIELKNDKNEIKSVVAAVPFLREKDIKKSADDETYEQRLSAMANGIIDFYKKIEESTIPYKKQDIPVIATGHLFILPQKKIDIDSKSYMLGGLQQLSVDDLAPFYDYLALGHIHKPMKLNKAGNIRYSGSPIHLNFSESGEKQVVLVEIADNKVQNRTIAVPKFRDMLNLKGTFNFVQQNIETFKNEFELKAWAEVTIVEEKQDSMIEQKILDLKDRLTEIEILNYNYKFSDIEKEIENKMSVTKGLDELKPEDIFDKIIENEKEEFREELMDTMKELMSRIEEETE